MRMYIWAKGGDWCDRFQSIVGNDEGKGSNTVPASENGIDNKTLDTLKKNKNITLEKLCRILSCTPNDIVKFTA